MDTREMSSQEKDTLAGDVNERLGMQDEGSDTTQAEPEAEKKDTASEHARKRINARNREHERQMQMMQAKIAELESRMQPNAETPPPQYSGNADIDGTIHQAVNYALKAKEAEEQKLRDQERAAHVYRQYQELNKHLDSMGDKYDDFDDVVRADDIPFTSHMRDAALLLPQKGPGSAGEVLYKLGKNKSELSRISQLHPLEQARELNKLSHALANGAETKEKGPEHNPIGSIKSNPVVNSHAITEKTPPSEIRARMKAGKFK